MKWGRKRGDGSARTDRRELRETPESGVLAATASADDLSWAIVKMRAGERITVNAALITAFQAASSPHSIRALRCDLEAFDLWPPQEPHRAAGDAPRGLNVRALLENCADDLPGLRDRAPLSTGYGTGLRASELVAIDVEHIIEAIDADARLLTIKRSKGDQEGEGATAFLSPRTVRAIAAWLEAANIKEGPVFRRVNVRHYKARAAVRGRPMESISGREAWDLRKTLAKSAVPARTEYDVGEGALHPASVGPIYRSMIQRAFDAGALADLTANDLVRLLKGVSAHSTRIGLNQDLFASGEDLAGIMDALRWKSPRMPLAYNRNLAAEQGAAGRLMEKLRGST